MNTRRPPLRRLAAALVLGIAGNAWPADAVFVTATLDPPEATVGQRAVLVVHAQINPAITAQCDRIFSWHVDLTSGPAAVASPDFTTLAMPASDSPDGSASTASTGTGSGDTRVGIRNTFMNLPGAGVAGQVELFRVEIDALAPGTATFTVRAGTADGMAHDFIVAPLGGGTPFTGGVYVAATATLVVRDPTPPDPAAIKLAITRQPGSVLLTFQPQAGIDHTVQFSDTLLPSSWQALPGAPHNSGEITDTTTTGVPRRFYRVALTAAGQ